MQQIELEVIEKISRWRERERDRERERILAIIKNGIFHRVNQLEIYQPKENSNLYQLSWSCLTEHAHSDSMTGSPGMKCTQWV